MAWGREREEKWVEDGGDLGEKAVGFGSLY